MNFKLDSDWFNGTDCKQDTNLQITLSSKINVNKCTGRAQRCRGFRNQGGRTVFRTILLHSPSPPPWGAKVLAIGKRWLGSNCPAVRDVDAFFMWHKVALYQMTRIFLGVQAASLTLHEIARESKIGNSFPRDWELLYKGCVARHQIPPSWNLSRPYSQMDGINFIVESESRLIRRFEWFEKGDNSQKSIRYTLYTSMNIK